MYGHGHPGQNFIPHSAQLNQQYCSQNISNEHYGYENAQSNDAYQIPPTQHSNTKEDQQQPHRSTFSAIPSVIVEVHDDEDSDSDYHTGGRKRCKTSKSNDNNKGGRSAGMNSASSKVGRHQDEVRTLFRYENGMWFCPICNQSVSPRAGRMKTHFEKCRTLAEYRIAKEVDSIGETSTTAMDGLNSTGCEESSESTSLSCKDFQSKEPSNAKKTTKNKNVRNHGGRIKSDVWSHYEERQGLFYCKRCSKRVSSKAHRLTQHLATACVNSPSFIAGELRKVGLRPSNESSMTESHEIRQQFDFRNSQWICQKCQKVVSSSIDNMKKHLEMWCGITPSVLGGSSGASMEVSTPSSSSAASRSAHNQSAKRSDTVMMNAQLGKLIFRSNLPFNIVENSDFIKFVKLISRNSYAPPSVADLGGSILTEIQTELENEMSKTIADKCVTLVQYGWSVIPDVGAKRYSDSQSMPFEQIEEYNQKVYLIIHCLHNGQRSFFLNATEISVEDSTSHTCLKLLENSMDNASKKYNCKFVGILTDLAVKDSIHERYPTLHVYGCYKDVFNLIGRDLARSDIVNPVLRVQEYFSSLSSTDNLTILEGVVVTTPTSSDNDWKNQLDTVQSFSTNLEKYREAVSTSNTFHVTESIKSILENRDLCEKVEQLLFVLTRLDGAYKKVKNDTPVIADAVSCWLDLMNNVYTCTAHDEKIKEGITQFVTPMAIAAYLLHPVYRGENMDLELQEVGRLWLLGRDPMYVVFQSALERGDTTYFPASLLNQTVAKQMSPAVWWEHVSKWPKIPEGLANLAVSLMILPATNMVSEYFPAIVEMVSSQKKSLGWEKTLQLCKAYFDQEGPQ